ncbi:MAG: nucleoside deaminase [Alphaproteobacteria bacterium]
MNKSAHYMKMAIEAAAKAEWPFGAVIVKDGVVLAVAGAGSPHPDATAHSEVNAIRMACTALGTESLKGATMYASCEPCLMCFAATWYADIHHLVYGSTLADMQTILTHSGPHLAAHPQQIVLSGLMIESGLLQDEVMGMYRNHPKAVT